MQKELFFISVSLRVTVGFCSPGLNLQLGTGGVMLNRIVISPLSILHTASLVSCFTRADF